MATQNYEVTVNPNSITLDLTTQNNILTVQTVDYILSLSRTGGQGAQGYSAYEIAVQNGYTGTAQQFADELASIDEKSALAVASATAAANSATSATNSATASATSASNSSTSAGAASASANAAAQSAVTAAAQSNNSAQSAINAAASALEASNWADASEDSAIDSELSAADAAASEDAAASSEANALLYRNEAQTAATSAGASSTNANAQALAASLSAASAATSATNADNSEDNAASSATSALNSATSANTSANQAAISATTATTQATSATNSATAAAASQADALVSKNSASASASTATTKASEASNSAATASTKATEASASAAQAVLSATSASTSASTATLKAAEAAQSAADAAAAQAAAEASLASFRSTYLGELNADPTLDGNGDPVMIGAEYFNSVANKLKVYTSTGWQFYDATAQTASQNAALSASQAASSAATSQSYATTAINKAAEAATSANAADASADAALASENAAESSEINASASENYALNYKNAAATSADLASSYASASGVSATNAATSATTATTQATNSANSATASATSATNSANSALASANSATNAANSAASAATSAANAGVSEANADTSEANALASANTATTKAAEASTSATNAATSATNSAASATSSALSEGIATTAAATATTKASEASVSATSASGSATTATTKAAEATTAATSANTSATNAATSATNAANSASSATTSSASASTSATLAGNSANAAALSETNAATSASAANTYASNAATSASSADTSESNAEIYADNALASSIAAANTVTTVTGYANTASTKADEASASATSAANSATSATASANTATTQATNASNSATAASTSASSATASATVATNQATSAASSASTASTAASAASASATNAATSATNASNSANAAGVAKAAAEAARDQALAAFDNFDDKYLGEKESNPSLDNDGNTLTTGALYFNTTLQGMRVYTGTAWVAAYMSGDGYLLGSNNLSDLTNVGTARFNLGLGTSALANGYNLDGLTDVTISSATNGQILEYESATNLWKNKTINALPAQATHNGQFLTTDGTNASWATVDALPPQATHADKFLRTDGTAAYWATVNLPTSAYSRTSFTATAGQTTFNVTYPLGSIQVYVNGVLLRTSDYTATNETSFTLNVPASAGAAVDAFVYNVYGIGQVLAQNIIGTVSIGSGGTGATTASGARTNLGLGTAATTDSTAYATAAQGAKADTALQPATIGVSVQGYNANTVIDSAYVHTDNNYTTTEKSKLAGIAAGAEVNVNPDWNATTGDAAILNKPTLGTASAQNVGYFATAAQGTLADNAVSNITSNDGSVVISTTGTVKDLSVGIAGSTATLISQVRNETGATLTKGTVVYISGASGNKAVVSKALATGDSTSAQTYGMVQADIPNNSNGYVVVIGVVSGLNTLAFAEGVQLYLSPTTAGTYTNTKPYAPNHLVYVGVVTRSHANQGTIEVKIQNGYEMDELHDVSAQNPTNGDTLVYVSSTDLWTKTPQSSLSVASAAAVPFSGVTGKPTTLSGYGITDAYSSSNPSGYISGITSSNVTTALGYTPENAANKGNANGYASLDGSGLVPASQLPSYVDDVLEYANLASFPGTGATGKIYVAIDTNKTYRWSGSAYIYITSGAVDSVAGKTGVVTLNNSDVGLGSVENKSSATIRGEITSSNVTTALGYTPYNATNPSGYITSSALSPYLTSSTAASTYFPLNGSGTLTGPYLDFNQSTVSLRITSGPGRFNIGDDDSVVLANAFRFYTGGTDGSAAFGDFRTNPATGNSIISAKTGGLYFNYDHGTGGVLFCNGATGVVGTVDASGNANFIGAITQNSNQVLHAGNFGSYALPLTGGTVSGLVRINNQLRVGQNTNGTAYIDAYDGYAWFGRDSNSTGIRIDASGNVNVTGALTQGGNQVLHAGNYNSYAPTLTGGGASGTWGINISGSANTASNSNTVGGLAPAQFFNNMGNNHSTYTDFNSVPGFGAYYVQQGTNSPTGVAANQWYGFTLGLGNQYSLVDYGTQIYWPRRAQNGDTYIYIRDREGGSWTSWTKVKAGYADTAGSATDSSKLPLSGGTMSGAISFQQPVGLNFANGQYIRDNGSGGLVVSSGAAINLNSGSSVSISGTNSGSAPVIPITVTGSGAFQRGVRMLNSGMGAGDSLMYAVGAADNSKNMGQFYFYYAGSGSNSNRISMGLHSVDDIFNLFGTGNISLGTTSDSGFRLNVSGTGNATNDFRAPIFYDSNNTGHYVDPAGTSQLNVANGNRFSVPNSALLSVGDDSATYTYNDSSTRSRIYASSSYPVLTLNSTVGTGNPNHGATIQFSFNGYDSNRQWVIGGSGTGTFLDFGTGQSSIKNPHDGIAGYGGSGTGQTLMRMTTTGIGIGGNWGPYGNVANPSYPLHVQGTGYASGDFRAPIFYDSNDTGYYLDPNGTSRLNTMLVGNGDYADIRMTDDNSPNGQKYIHANGNNIGFLGGSGSWIFRVDNSGIAITDGSFRAPIFYDSNDTGFYLDPAGTSVLNVLSDPALSDSRLYLRTRGDTNHYLWNASDDWEELVAYSGTGFRVSNSNGTGSILTCFGNINGNYVQAVGSMRAPIFYDSDNTGYYCNPAGDSNFDGLSIGTGSGGNQRIRFNAGNDTSSYSALRFSFAGSETQQIHIFGANWQGGTFLGASAGAINISGQNGVTLGSWPSPGMAVNNSGETWIRGNINLGYDAAYAIGRNFWAGGGGYTGYQFSGGNNRFGFSSTGGVLDVYADGNFYATDSSHLVLHAGNYSSYALPISGGTVSGSTSFTSGSYCAYMYGQGNTGAVAGIGMNVYSGNGAGAIMAFHRGGYYAVNFGLDSDNVMRIGGWSAGANRWQLDMSGNGTYAGNVTAYSDERLKTNWRDMPENYVARLAQIKVGIYDRLDEENVTQVGVSAQSLRELLPQAIMTSNDQMQTLSVSYGNAALASAVELAKEVVDLKSKLNQQQSELDELKSLVKSLLANR